MKNTLKEEKTFYGAIPAEVLEEMEPQVIRQYFLWDEILKREAELYLEHTKNTPDVERCRIHFQDGGSGIFSVPVMKVQEYSLKMIEERKLFLLIPFTVIRYRKYIDSETKRIHKEKARNDLTGFIKECIMTLNRQVINGTMTEIGYRDITELLWKAFVQLFNKDGELIGEVQESMRSIIRLTSDDLRDALHNLETGIRNIIMQCKKDGKSRDETGEFIQNIFTLKEDEAEEKLMLYWEE